MCRNHGAQKNVARGDPENHHLMHPACGRAQVGNGMNEQVNSPMFCCRVELDTTPMVPHFQRAAAVRRSLSLHSN